MQKKASMIVLLWVNIRSSTDLVPQFSQLCSLESQDPQLCKQEPVCLGLKSLSFSPSEQSCPYLFCLLGSCIHYLLLYEKRIEPLTTSCSTAIAWWILTSLYSRKNVSIRITYSEKVQRISTNHFVEELYCSVDLELTTCTYRVNLLSNSMNIAIYAIK